MVQYAIQGTRNFPAGLVHSGTGDGASVIRRTGQASGAGDVHVTGGTMSVDIVAADEVTIAAGTQQTLGTLGTNEGVGTLTTVGQIHNAGTIANFAAGADLPGGTIDEVTLVPTVTNLTSGSVRMTVGTMTTGSLANVAQVHNAGTLQAGTVQIDSQPARNVIRTGTLGTTAVEKWGTLVIAAGAGDNYYILGYEIIQHTGTTAAAIQLGTRVVTGGTDTFGQGFYPPGGGVSRNLTSPVVSGANGTITYYMGGAGTTFFSVDYYEIG